MSNGPDDLTPAEFTPPAAFSVTSAPALAHDPEPATAVDGDGGSDDGASDAPASSGGKRRKPKEPRSFLSELPILLGIAVILALLLRIFMLQAFFIPSESMKDTLHVKDRVLVNKIGYKFHDPHRGDIVVFNGKHTNFPPENIVAPASNAFQGAVRKVQKFLGFGSLGERDYIKRVIGVGGDTISCCTNGSVEVNGRALDESYVLDNGSDNVRLDFCANPTTPLSPQTGPACRAPGAKPYVVPKGYLFVMGDNRGNSSDSRFNGVIPKSAVIGRAFVLIWPLSRLDMFGTPPDFS